ncbi:hypothetical protein CPAR01_14966 [Colletotrichum paranaense]|uniref:Aminoglycoside phosphotransferase domain-containing protein n=1 Tax=Colletotrichum paranaense TaxID=1914294 RepID=A0ABQ9S1T7_9PEZI|nr:uncharacterized protein CPAR01_14966 [Colletotrichum paranaense]KAK1521443.1 hypothetical protein CPAR01_14966 [Colletotrichum paranaense]
MDPRNLAPDDVILNHIFPNQPHISIGKIFVQTWDKCVFKASIPDDREQNAREPDASEPPPSYLVRLEVVAGDDEATQFATVSAMQQIASLAIHELIPETCQIGVANNAKGKRVHFSVTEFVKGETLEEAWEQMSEENQRSVVTALVEALRKLHSIWIRDFLARIQYLAKNELFRASGPSGEHILGGAGVMGGPSTGFFASKDGPSFLGAVAKRWELSGRPFHTMATTESGNLVVQSEYSDLGFVKVGKSSMEEWYREAVLCHNDLNPRNIIVSRPSDSDSASTCHNEASDYQLSAIIDWELSGFYPPSYELSLQDTYLSGANRQFSFYSLLKNQMKEIVPRSPSQISLLQAMQLLFESRQRRLREGNNIPAIIRERFIQRLQLRRDEDPYLGWVPKDHEAARLVLSFADVLNIERDVVAEREARREAKAASRLQVGTGSDS